MSVRLLINGSRGRMGQMLIACAAENPALSIGATVDVGDDFAAGLAQSDAVIDFSHHSTCEAVLAACVAGKKTVVFGTTGHCDAEVAAIHAAAKQIPVVFSGNYSTGVNALYWLSRKAAEILGPDFDIEILETHHRLKKDAPSGTAKNLAEILTGVRDLEYNNDVLHGRHGDVGARTRTEIGMHAIRGGDVVGDHTVLFASPGERVELTHKASGREIFARGALRAALWAHGKPAGLYTMQDVLGLK